MMLYPGSDYVSINYVSSFSYKMEVSMRDSQSAEGFCHLSYMRIPQKFPRSILRIKEVRVIVK